MKAATVHSADKAMYVKISIHAAREGGDGFGFCPCRRAERFQSTPPVKAATVRSLLQKAGLDISIHAAREGGDTSPLNLKSGSSVFQSTPPVKAATEAADRPESWIRFQSTPPVKAATHAQGAYHTAVGISIHAAREGGDCGNE